jgi:HPt (histidine-containing phosphotransfer) domain-containing protein
MGLLNAMNPAIDPAALDTLRELNPDDPSFLRELIDVFLEDVPQRLAELERALASQDAALFTRAAHTIKGSCSNFGAANLAHLAFEMEKLGKAGTLAEGAAHLPALKAEFALVAEALKAFR